MINSISSTNSAMMMRVNSTQQQPPPPPGKDAFKVADSDQDGLVSSTELEAVISGMSETGSVDLNAETAITTYDLDEDGGLSGEEMMNLLADSGFGPPQGINGDSDVPPPPPPSMDQALSSYSENSGDDLLSQLITMLQDSGEKDEARTPFSITS